MGGNDAFDDSPTESQGNITKALHFVMFGTMEVKHKYAEKCFKCSMEYLLNRIYGAMRQEDRRMRPLYRRIRLEHHVFDKNDV